MTDRIKLYFHNTVSNGRIAAALEGFRNYIAAETLAEIKAEKPSRIESAEKIRIEKESVEIFLWKEKTKA